MAEKSWKAEHTARVHNLLVALNKVGSALTQVVTKAAELEYLDSGSTGSARSTKAWAEQGIKEVTTRATVTRGLLS